MRIAHESLPTIKPRALKIIQDLLKNNVTKQKIIDLGSGSQPNILLGLNKKYSFNYYAVDKNKKSLEMFKKRASKESFFDLKTICANIENIPFKSNSIDIVIFLETIEHLKYPERTLREIVRISNSATTVLISTPNIKRPDILLKRIFFFFAKGNKSYPKDYYYSPKHVKEWEKENFYNLLKQSGIIVKEWILIPYPLEFVNLKSIITLIIYPLINIFMYIFRLKSISPILFAVCSVKKKL